MTRNYTRDYRKWGSSQAAIRKRSKTNKIRRILEKAAKDRPAGFKRFKRVSKGDNTNVNHKDGNQDNESPSNIEVISESENKADVKGKRKRAKKGKK